MSSFRKAILTLALLATTVGLHVSPDVGITKRTLATLESFADWISSGAAGHAGRALALGGDETAGYGTCVARFWRGDMEECR